MIKINKKHQDILIIFLEKETSQSSDVHAELSKRGSRVALITIKRALSEMVDAGLLKPIGSGRSARYEINAIGRIFAEVDAKAYSAVDPDKRYGFDKYNFDLLPSFPSDIFTNGELEILNDATAEYERRTRGLSPTIQKKELERLVIELSWKSAKMEGNTYTLLDTEKLILENKLAPGKTQKETRMILNHKDAFNFVHEHAGQFKTLTQKNLEELHAILVKNLSVSFGLRKKPAGVVGSKYRPLDNLYQIAEAVGVLSKAVSRISTPYAKALTALLGISYIQPFEDGNKRTGRLMANAILLAGGKSPLSYRSVDENEYREALMAFYELNSLMPFKKIFIGQYNFAAKNYAVK